MKDVKDFDVNEYIPNDSMTETTAVGGDARPSRRSVSSKQSVLTGRNEATGQTAPISLGERAVKSLQAASTSTTEQSAPNRQTALAPSTEPIQQIEPPQPTQPTQLSRVSSRQRRASLDEYRETFLTIPKITDRQPVFVSRDVRDKIDSVVRRLGERRMSVSGFLENLARHHLDLYTDDLEQWKRL